MYAGVQTRQGISWSIKRYTGGAEPRASIATLVKDSFFTVPRTVGVNSSAIPKDRSTGREHAIGTLETISPNGDQQTSHMNLLIYRGQFLITFAHNEPKVGVDMLTESTRIIKKSKELIDLRFPED